MNDRNTPRRPPCARIASAALCAALLLAGTGGAQEPGKLPRVRGAVELSLVNVDVAVTGKDGRPIEGLSASDFVVRHGKATVSITNFREERLAPRAEVATAAPAPGRTETATVAPEAPPARRHVVLFVDHLALPDRRERGQVFGALKELVRRTVRPGDGVMVVSWRRGVQTAWPYTDDVKQVERALDVVAEGTIRLGREAQDDLDQFAATEAFQVWAGEPSDTSLSRDLSVEAAVNELKGKASAVMGLVSTMAGLEGKKVLVLASRSFWRRPGVEFSGHRVEAARLIEEVAARANAAGVTIHALYAAAWQPEMPNVADLRQAPASAVGSRAAAGRTDARLEDLAGLETLSGRTGGILVGTTMEAPLFAEKVTTDLGHWYSIGYPVPPGASASARVSVRVNRPGAKVRTRREVVDRTPEQRMEDRVLANLFRADLSGRLPIGLSVEPARKEGERFVRTAVLGVPVRHLVLLPEGAVHRGAVTVSWIVAEPTGEFSAVRSERHEVALPEEEAAPDSKTELRLEIRVESGGREARVSLGVRDEVGGEAGFGLIRPAAR